MKPIKVDGYGSTIYTLEREVVGLGWRRLLDRQHHSMMRKVAQVGLLQPIFNLADMKIGFNYSRKMARKAAPHCHACGQKL